MRKCNCCHKVKPFSDFYKCPSVNGAGICRLCKDCISENGKKYYRENRKKILKRIHKYLKTPKAKELSRIKTQRMMEKYPEKFRTRQLTRNYIKMGKIKKKPCEICGETKVEAHHTDYSDAINVHWYCRLHHRVIEGKSVI